MDHINGITFVDRITNHDDFYKLDDNGNLQELDYDTEVKPTGILRDWRL